MATTPFHIPRPADHHPSRFQLAIDERIAREELPCFSESLSSIHRPRNKRGGAADVLLAPFAPRLRLLDFVFPYIPSFEFYFRMPFLSRAYKHLYTEAQLHKREAKNRFDMSDEQWQEFKSTAIHRLIMPVHKYAYFLENCKLEQDAMKDDFCNKK